MDTPERNQIGTPQSKFEDSPVFNYINNLSPIKPVKSVNVSQTFNSLTFAAIPSVFTSPHVKEFGFLQRHQSFNQDTYGKPSDNGSKLSSDEDVVDALLLRGSSSVPSGGFLTEASFGSHDEHPNLEVQLSQSLKFDSGSPEHNQKACSSGRRNGVPELDIPSASVVASVQEVSEKGSLQGQVHLQDICQIEQRKEESGCHWESSIPDTADVLICSSPDGTGTFQGSIQELNPGTGVCSPLISELPLDDDFTDLHKQYSVPANSGEKLELGDPVSDLKEIELPQGSLADTSPSKRMTNHQIKLMDDEARKFLPFSCKPNFNLHRGMQRRLVFEMTGTRRKNLHNSLDTGSPNQLQSDGNVSSNDKHQGPFKLGIDTPRRTLPAIGLHLNSLAITLKDRKFVKHEIMATESQLISGTSSNASIHSPSTNQELTANSLDLTCSERDNDPNESDFHAGEDTLQASLYAAIEELNQSSPKKKRRKLDQAGENESCKRCNCKKSKCLKLYCECFAAGVYCVEPCSCQECFNKPIHEDTVLATRKQIESRNPLAFAPKVIRSSDSIPDIGDESNKTPASARHKRGCNCKKSNCLKKYCECYQGGVGCSIGCRCEGCKNAFGRKDGSVPLGIDDEPEGEETETGEKNADHLHNTQSSEEDNDNLDSAPSITPSQIIRSSGQPPFPSKRKPPRSSFLAKGSSSTVLHVNRRLGRPNFLLPHPKFEKDFQAGAEDEMPDILHCSPSSGGIKNVSPNSKRVSPPHCDFGPSPSRQSSRKLILRSIPSFPSLTQN